MKSSNVEKIYQELKQTLTDEEIAESFIFSVKTKDTEQAKREHAEFLRLRMERLHNMPIHEKQRWELYGMQIRIEKYLKTANYDAKFSFANQLQAYIKITRKEQEAFAKDISLEETTLHQLLNQGEQPSIALMYRLEKHSQNKITAQNWWRLYALQQENEIENDSKKRAEEADKVKDTILIAD
ncbi:MAG: hypothetical protein AB8G22_08825 [Saprospiraceae bacterium]